MNLISNAFLARRATTAKMLSLIRQRNVSEVTIAELEQLSLTTRLCFALQASTVSMVQPSLRNAKTAPSLLKAHQVRQTVPLAKKDTTVPMYRQSCTSALKETTALRVYKRRSLALSVLMVLTLFK